jgi:hypothetical protein
VNASATPAHASLLAQHQALIDCSAILPEVAAARGYRSVTDRCELAKLGFSSTQRRVPCLLLPLYSVQGSSPYAQIRPDHPRLRRGKLVKYETPTGVAMRIDVPPLIRERLGDPHEPLWITEGIRKADSAVSKGLTCIDLLGVWNWRGSNVHGGKVALPDWESIALNDRRVFLAFDSDVMGKVDVRRALARLHAFLERRGARVKVVRLPETLP